jgi:Tol biopolymer transport system component
MKDIFLLITIAFFLFGCSPDDFERNPNLIFLAGDLNNPASSYMNPVWSPDGQVIYFLHATGPRDIVDGGHLRAVNVNGSNNRLIETGPFGALAISPDGNRLALTRDATFEEGGILVLMDTSGVNEETLATSLPYVLDVKFFSDGDRLIFNAYGANDPDSNGFYSIDNDGLNESFILKADSFLFDLAPNDSLIYFGNYTYTFSDSTLRSFQIGGDWMRFNPMDTDQLVISFFVAWDDFYLLILSTQERIALDVRTYEESFNIFPSWSPDGSMIVFSSAERVGSDPSHFREFELWILTNVSN